MAPLPIKVRLAGRLNHNKEGGKLPDNHLSEIRSATLVERKDEGGNTEVWSCHNDGSVVVWRPRNRSSSSSSQDQMVVSSGVEGGTSTRQQLLPEFFEELNLAIIRSQGDTAAALVQASDHQVWIATSGGQFLPCDIASRALSPQPPSVPALRPSSLHPLLASTLSSYRSPAAYFQNPSPFLWRTSSRPVLHFFTFS
jgi:hypothetical protein